MASEADIKAAITKIVGRYSAWTVGVTDSPTRRKKEHGNPSHWHQWNAATELVARRIEAHFLAKGMHGDTGGGGDADYVYIFL